MLSRPRSRVGPLDRRASWGVVRGWLLAFLLQFEVVQLPAQGLCSVGTTVSSHGLEFFFFSSSFCCVSLSLPFDELTSTGDCQKGSRSSAGKIVGSGPPFTETQALDPNFPPCQSLTLNSRNERGLLRKDPEFARFGLEEEGFGVEGYMGYVFTSFRGTYARCQLCVGAECGRAITSEAARVDWDQKKKLSL